MSARLSDYDYDLPRELIAQRPPDHREDSRMMVLDRARQAIEHRLFRQLTRFVRSGDLFVLNGTRVLPARRFSDDGAVEFLFLERLSSKCWKCLVKPGRKMRIGATARIANVVLRVDEITVNGERIVASDEELDPYSGGSMPLPPYIKRPSDDEDLARYQAVFARATGAVAAPTAGLHFTPEILNEIPHALVTLRVGPGTFLPVRAEEVTEHRMHAECFSVSREAADKINSARRVLAVGTTVVRVLETAASQAQRSRRIVGQAHRLPSAGGAPALQESQPDQINAHSGETDPFIYPSFAFRSVDGLLTTFSLPRSTLLMLVSAFAGRDFLLRAYEQAIHERYRFYSYGDCMLIL